MIANVLNRDRSGNFQKKFQNNSWLVDGNEVWMWSCGYTWSMLGKL